MNDKTHPSLKKSKRGTKESYCQKRPKNTQPSVFLDPSLGLFFSRVFQDKAAGFMFKKTKRRPKPVIVWHQMLQRINTHRNEAQSEAAASWNEERRPPTDIMKVELCRIVKAKYANIYRRCEVLVSHQTDAGLAGNVADVQQQRLKPAVWMSFFFLVNAHLYTVRFTWSRSDQSCM